MDAKYIEKLMRDNMFSQNTTYRNVVIQVTRNNPDYIDTIDQAVDEDYAGLKDVQITFEKDKFNKLMQKYGEAEKMLSLGDKTQQENTEKFEKDMRSLFEDKPYIRTDKNMMRYSENKVIDDKFIELAKNAKNDDEAIQFLEKTKAKI